MIYTLNGTAYETATEAVASQVEGYSDIQIDDEAIALIARYEHAVTLAGGVQTDLLLENPGIVLTDEELAILSEDKSAPLFDGEWTADVPLVLVATDYAPYVADRMPPTGNIVWINPADETQFLISLAEVGVVTLQMA